MALVERKHAYLQYQGSRKMGFALDKAYLRRLAKGWIRWVALVEAGRAEECRMQEISAAVTVQTAFRGLAARRRRARLAVAASDKQRHFAAVAITRCVKGKVARMRYGRLKADVERVRASKMLRRVGRGMLGRRKARRLREERAKLKVRRDQAECKRRMRVLFCFFTRTCSWFGYARLSKIQKCSVIIDGGPCFMPDQWGR